jgi:hypothetical protein
MLQTYEATLPNVVERDEGDAVASINIVTPVDVKQPIVDADDLRRGGVLDQFKRIEQERLPHRLFLFETGTPREKALEYAKRIRDGGPTNGTAGT